MSKCGTGATGIAAIGTAHRTGIAGTMAQTFASTPGRGGITIIGATITIGITSVTNYCHLN